MQISFSRTGLEESEIGKDVCVSTSIFPSVITSC